MARSEYRRCPHPYSVAPAEGLEKCGPRRPTRSGHSCNNAPPRPCVSMRCSARASTPTKRRRIRPVPMPATGATRGKWPWLLGARWRVRSRGIRDALGTCRAGRGQQRGPCSARVQELVARSARFLGVKLPLTCVE